MDELNKEVFSINLQRYMDTMGVSRNKLSDDLGFPYTTISDWLSGRKYPRIDKIEKLANYFNVSKSDLIERYEIQFQDSYDIHMFNTLTSNYYELSADRKQKLVDFSEKLKNHEPVRKEV